MKKPEIIELFDTTVEDTEVLIDLLIESREALMFTETEFKKCAENYKLIRKIDKELKRLGCTE